MQRFAWLILLLGMAPMPVAAQTWGTIEGTIRSSNNQAPLPGATVLVEGTNYGTATNRAGRYRLRVPTGSYRLRFSSVGYQTVYDSVTVTEQTTPVAHNVALQPRTVEMQELTVESDEAPKAAGVYTLDPEEIERIPSPLNDGLRALKVVPGVATNNELSHQYSVRGGGYNENLVFINGFQVFMPFRPRQGEQEGLSLVNPALAQSVTFYAGGFPARYGGKLSSALDVQYYRPEDQPLTGQAEVSLFDVSANARSSALNGDLGWTLGVRHARPGQFFATQELKGDYDPQFTDVQGALTYRLAPGHQIDALGIWADHTFRLEPGNRKTYFGILSLDPEIPSNLQALWVDYEGTRRDGYTTQFGGIRLSDDWTDRFSTEHALAYFGTKETEDFNITGQADLFQVDPTGDPDSGAGHVGIGSSLTTNVAHNTVSVNTLTGRGRYQYTLDRHVLEAGWHLRGLSFNDRINERTIATARVRDNGRTVQRRIVIDSLQDRASFSEYQSGLYVQDAIDVLPDRDKLTLTGGLRADYFSFNDAWTVSPRLSLRYTHSDQLTLTGAWGIYHQKPTYRELRGAPDPGESILGALNRDIRSQRAMEFVLGGTYFMPDKRLYLRAETYYKRLRHLISYRIDDVRVEYSGENDTRGYAYGLDLQLRGEFVPGLESWFNYSFLVTRERFKDPFQTAFNQGLNPRPSDQRHTFSAFIQDYVPGDKTWKLHMRLLYGSGLPYTPPVPGPRDPSTGQVIQVPGPRMNGRLPAYRRVDVGAVKRIALSDARAPMHLSLSFEILNLFDMTNTVGYSWFVDGRDTWTRVPKHLTPRAINVGAKLSF
ncbi:TonB-dependent receptor [Salisaeta longa]|uniref:TonB-dependent receptor n=1 Tax=Salisaeta longa TaxID=503170 RepID=UPI0003B74598|nr:TonB-dependent receptor [Salisaeta longa]